MKIDFGYDTEYGRFEDALWFPDDEPLPSPEEIKAMELERLNHWLEVFTTQPSPAQEQPL